MKQFLFILVFVALANGCAERPSENPLFLPGGAEPSATLHNDMGMDYFRQANYKEAVIQFLQAKVADPHAGEIHFNIALCRHVLGDGRQARESFQLAKQYARDNPDILQSPLLKSYFKN